jgi:ABC-type multidrug transport system fused ATPase/permease subunit
VLRLFRKLRDKRRDRKALSEGAWTQWRAAPHVLPFLRPYKGLVVLSFIMMVLASVVALAEPWPLAFVIDSVLDDHPPPGPLKDWFGVNPDPYRLLIFIVVCGFLI